MTTILPKNHWTSCEATGAWTTTSTLFFLLERTPTPRLCTKLNRIYQGSALFQTGSWTSRCGPAHPSHRGGAVESVDSPRTEIGPSPTQPPRACSPFPPRGGRGKREQPSNGDRPQALPSPRGPACPAHSGGAVESVDNPRTEIAPPSPTQPARACSPFPPRGGRGKRGQPPNGGRPQALPSLRGPDHPSHREGPWKAWTAPERRSPPSPTPSSEGLTTLPTAKVLVPPRPTGAAKFL